jgi:digeranylgeranylglycerophospholipid reductase
MSMKYDHDVIVIGGGPAGSSFARVAAQEGLDVLVVDKRKEIGVPVRCGEGLGNTELLRQDLEMPRQCYSTKIVGAKVIAPSGKEIVWKSPETSGWVLERKVFDMALRARGRKGRKGAHLHAGSRNCEGRKGQARGRARVARGQGAA